MLPWLLVGVLAVVGFRRLRLGYPPAPAGLRALSDAEYHIARTAARIVYPEGGAVAASGESARVAERVDRFVAVQPASNRALIRLLFLLVEQATLVFSAGGRGGRRRFSALDPAQQLAYLDRWRRSSRPVRRLVFLSLRALLTMGYFADPDVLRGLGLLPRSIATPPSETDHLWPPIGERPRAGAAPAEPSPEILAGGSGVEAG